MAGEGDHTMHAMRVVDGVDAGGEAGLKARGDVIEVQEDLRGVEVEFGQGADGGAELSHGRGSVDPAAHHVTDDQGGLVARHGNGVEPVTADLRGDLGGW